MLDQLNQANSFFLIAGPCAIEGKDMAMDIAGKVQEITSKFNIPYIFKGSFRKANRSRLDSFTGIGDQKALDIISEVGQTYSLPTTTDIHKDEDAAWASKHVDVLQIPAFLCRQTSLLVAAAHTGKVVNIKKGQFMSPESMQFAVDKVKQSGNDQIWLTERGNFFGYQDLIVDFRSIVKMNNMGVPSVLDCTHCLQKPNQTSGVTGGDPDMIETMAKAGIAVGVKGLFIETHPNPSVAKSDGANMLSLDKLEPLLEKCVKIYQTIS